MSDHTLALVPLSSGYHQSIDQFARRRRVDTGLLAEALVYYDRVLLNVDNPEQFAELISWLIQQGLSVPNIMALFCEGVLGVYDFSFTTNPYVMFSQPDGIQIHGVFHIQDPIMQAPNSFSKRYLEFAPLRNTFSNQNEYDDFVKVLEGRVVEVKADDVGASPIDNAYKDFLNAERNSLMTQQLVDEIYRLKYLGRSPKIEASIKKLDDGRTHVSWNIPLNELPAVDVETKIVAGATLPLTTAVQGNKYLWAAKGQNCDLYLTRPVSVLVGDKLFEAADATNKNRVKPDTLITSLQRNVEFPDLRQLVNLDQIDFNEVLKFRKKAGKFRKWLQLEGDRDRNEIVAYHREVARESGFIKGARSTLKLFGVLGGAAAGTVVTANPLGAGAGAVGGALIGTALGEGVKYLADLGASVGADWKPVVFGDWYSDRIKKLLEESPSRLGHKS